MSSPINDSDTPLNPPPAIPEKDLPPSTPSPDVTHSPHAVPPLLSSSPHTASQVEPGVEKAAGTVTANGPKGRKVAQFSLLYNSFWVFLGICSMLAGTLVVHRALLPRVYVCPGGATCRHNIDLRGNIIPRLQTLMQYWLQGGVAVAGWGLAKFISYDSRFILEKEGSTIRTLERNTRAVEGSWTDAGLLVLAPLWARVQGLFTRVQHGLHDTQPSPPLGLGTTWLGILALVQVGIGLFISFVVGFSITDLQGMNNVHVPFSYHSSFTLPHLDTRFFSTEERIIASQLNNWLVAPGRPQRPNTVFDGTLVLRDNRTLSATNPQPTGSRITGDISCSGQGWNVSLMPLDSHYLADGHAGLPPGGKAYNISRSPNLWFVTYSYTSLASQFISDSELSDSITNRPRLWTSNASNVIPNATASPDGGLYYTVCNHTIRMVDLPPVAGPGVQVIYPSQPIIYTSADDPFLYPCPSKDPIACVPWNIDDIMLAWWQTNVVFQDLIPFSCLGGLLVGYEGLSDTTDCVLNDVRWAKTVSTALDALISTAGMSGNASQELWATTESINTDRWWIQTILPGVTFLLYLACIAYTLHLSGGGTTDLQELDFPAILCRRDLIEKLDAGDIRDTEIERLNGDTLSA